MSANSSSKTVAVAFFVLLASGISISEAFQPRINNIYRPWCRPVILQQKDDITEESIMAESPNARKPSDEETEVCSEPLVWCKEANDDGSTSSFEEVCLLAAETHRPLHLSANVILKETITLRKRQHLVIKSSVTDDARVSISGDLHSLFLLNNHSQLFLENIDLKHTLEADDHRKVGAAVNLRYKSTLAMTDCSISSTCGFCCWAVQKTSVRLHNCQLEATLRSPVVCFGQPKVLLQKCTIENAGVHAVCARGACHITIEHSYISKSACRAVYAYAQATVQLLETRISGTIRSDKAAVEVSAAGAGGPNGLASSITIQGCQIVDNAGVGLLLRGNVECKLQETLLERNAGGNKVQTESLQEESSTTTASSTTSPLQRDPSGSSFRQGDWWCPQCHPRRVVVGGHAECPLCQSTYQPEYCLSISEISQLNQGIISNGRSTKRNKWHYDGDERGWILYDDTSNELLEDAFQRYCKAQEQADPLVILLEGKYQVNLEKMEQVNLQSQFLRLVKRIESNNTTSAS
jgi:hypothetical protein